MPKTKRQGIFLSLIMSLIMIYIMAALNDMVKNGAFTSSSWFLALKRLPLGYLVGILCDLCVCTPLSRKLVAHLARKGDREIYLTFILRFSMVVLMTAFMTVFSVLIAGKFGKTGIADFFKWLPYNFTIALPIQMLIVAPLSLKLSVWIDRGIRSMSGAKKV